MAGSRRFQGLLWVLPVLAMFVGEAAAAVCTSVSAGRWDQSARWDCGHVPLSTDSVVISHNVQMRNNYTVAGLTINAGAVLDDNGDRLTSTGNVVINGTFGGNGGDLRMSTDGTTISGSGNIDDARLEIDGDITLASGAVLNFKNDADIRVGDNGTATFTIDGAITAVGIKAGQTILRADKDNTSTVVINGSIDAPTSNIEIQRNGTIQNNGSVSIAYLDGNGDTNVTWTQGANSTLTLSQPTRGWNNGTFTASATGNTVNFNGTATPFNPATYYNIGGVGVACPHPAGITVLGSTPCGPGAPTVTTAAATAITAVGGTLNGTVSSNQAITTVTLQYGLTAAYGTTATAAQSPLAANAVATPVSAAITGLTCGTLYHFRAVGSNSLGTTNGGDLTFNTAACPPVPAVVSINRVSTNPTTASVSVGWQVIFNTSVTGVNASDFSLVLSGMTGSSITAVTGSGTTWTVTANTGTGTGSLGLNLVDDDTILNGIGQKLGGTGAGNGNFTGQVYTVSAPVLSNVINTYYPGTASVAAGATSITLGAATGATTPIAKGDTLLILQMQDGSLNAANTDAYGDNTAGDLVGSGMTSAGGAGVYEYAIADSNVPLSGGTLTLACGTIKAYTNAAAVAGSAGQKKYQVIRVPSYASATLTSTLTASAWNGTAGGVLALDASGVLTLGGATVTLDGKGFRGGAGRNSSTGTGNNSDYRTATANLANGSKGEGIAGTPQYVFTPPATSTNTGVDGYPNGSFARGAPGNAGGGGTDRNPASNDQNSGGGGGGNGGAGGIGGIGWCPGFTTTAPYYGCGIAVLASTANPGGSTGGFGGTAVSGLGAARLTLGGGGGAATTNNATGTLGALSSSGAAGGGIIMIRAATMSGNATFNANGSNGDSTVGNDGSGGGGAGGAVLISAGSGMAGVTINVKGGKGGDNLVPGVGGTSNPHGPGGGGGGGYAITSAATAACSSTGGANGVTYRNGNPFGAYGASAGSSGSCVTGLTAAQIPGTLLGATGCGPSIDHYELSLPSNGVSCLAVTVTVTACSDDSSPCTSPITTINGETATLATDAGTLGATTVTFNATGTASTTLSYPAAGNGTSATVTLSGEQSDATKPRQCCPDGTSCSVADSCSATFNTSGFIFSASADGAVATIPSQVAGVSSAAYYLRAVKTNTTTKACETALSGANTVNFAYECNDPTACYAANKMGVGDGTLTTIARNDNGSVSSYTSVDMTFDANGNAPFTFTYGDVGQVKLHASKDAGGTLLSALTGQSNAFVVKPYDFEVLPCAASVVGDCTAGDVPADPGVGGGGAVFAKAGTSFKATVTARASGGAATPSFGAGSNNGTEKVNLTRTRVAPTAAGAVDGTLGGTTAIPRNSFSNGIATVSDLSWSEVGVITLTASNSTFLGNTLTTTGSTGNIGRFAPEHFDTEVILASGVPMPCPTGLTCPALYDGFVYSGQNFTLKVTAKNLNGGTTENYDNALGYEKTPSLEAWDALGSTTTQNPGGGTLVGAIAFSTGVANVAATKYSLATTTTAPTNIYVRAKDADGVTSLRATSVEGGVKVANGRVKISNAYGSEKLPLSVPVTVQFYDGALWQTSTTDGVTSLTLAASYNVDNDQSVTTGTTTPAGMTAWLNGTREIQLGTPTVGSTGNAIITFATLPSYLGDPVPTGIATFGIYKGSKEFIYLREAY